MLCALTVRKLKPGSFDAFADAFGPDEEEMRPHGWIRFDMLRDRSDPDHVVTFGFFDGSFDELEASQREMGYEERRERANEHVERVEVNGVFEVVAEMVAG